MKKRAFFLSANNKDADRHARLCYSLLRYYIIEPRHEKTNVLVLDLVQYKPDCKATEDG